MTQANIREPWALYKEMIKRERLSEMIMQGNKAEGKSLNSQILKTAFGL